VRTPRTAPGRAAGDPWRALVLLLAALLVALTGAGSVAAPASAAGAAVTYYSALTASGTSTCAYDAPAPLSAPLVTTAVAPRPLAGPGVASWVRHVSFGRFGVAADTAPSLSSLAEQIRTAGRPGAAVNQRTIAVGEDAAGNLYAGSSGGFDAGQRAAADALGLTRVPSRTVAGEAMHAEEDLVGAVPDPQRVRTSGGSPYGASAHIVASMLDDLGVTVDR